MSQHSHDTPNTFSSFLGIQEKSEEKSKELLKLTANLRNNLMMMQTNRRKKRYTQDGRLCASAFAQDGQSYFDCTTNRSPDGLLLNQEWCYVDEGAKGDRPWDYCKPTMDYDKIREETQNQIQQFTVQARKTLGSVEANIGPGQSALDSLKRVRTGQAELDSKINQLIKEILTLNSNMQNLFNTKDQWEKEEDLATEIATKTEMRTQKAKEDAANNFSAKMDTSDETIKKEVSNTKAVIAPYLQERIVNPTFDCGGMLQYEEDAPGDGLTASYYDNETFMGEQVEVKDPSINFDWTGASPTLGINPSNFSVRWEGFIYAPFTSNYQFAIECDDGGTITVNNELVVSHKMYSATDESKARVDDWLNNEVQKRLHPSKNFDKSTSINVKLTGGSKFKIVVSYYHSVHNDVMDNLKSFVRLYWSSDEFEETLVLKNYLFTQNSFAPLKISGFDLDNAVIRKIYENDLAFKNSDVYIMQDVPEEFRGLTTLKLNSKYLLKQLQFEINIPVIVYIAHMDHYPVPVSDDWEDTGEYLSLLQIEKPLPGAPHPIVLNSKRSALMRIHKKIYQEGKVNIPLNLSGVNAKGMPLIAFFGFDSAISSPTSCGGKELWISDPNSSYFKSCKDSSHYSANWKCSNGLNGRNKDSESNTWATQREGKGAFIEVVFDQLYQVTKVTIQNRLNPSERNENIMITYSNGDTEIKKLQNSGDEQTFIIDTPVKTSTIRFTIHSVYGSINNGGSFKVFGAKCIDANSDSNAKTSGLSKVTGINPKSIPAIFKNVEKSAITLICKDSLSNTKKLAHIKQSPESQVTIRCVESCSSADVPVYGDGKYAKDSSICRAAYHAQKLKPEGGLVSVVFKAGMANYKSQVRNGIRSKPKSKSDLTLTFEAADENEPILVATGSKIDVKDPKGSDYLPGVIMQVKETSSGKVLVIMIEASEGMPEMEIMYPNSYKIKPCGEKVKDRDCKGSRKTVNKDKPYIIKFAPPTYKTPGDYVVDKGEVFGKSGQPYGWSKDMSSRMRVRTGFSKPEMETLVEFSPSPKSKFCNKPNPDVLCDNITWSVKVGHGKFNVKIYVGDPKANTRIDLKVNDDYIVKDRTLGSGNLEIFEGAYDSVNEYITVSSVCLSNCEYAMSKMNMIELFPFKNEERKEPEPTPERTDPCGNALQGGRCDTGPDVSHCVFDDPADDAAKFCTGELLLVQVSNQYRCPTQRDKFKCVKKKYNDQGQCLDFCPGKCEKGLCF